MDIIEEIKVKFFKWLKSNKRGYKNVDSIIKVVKSMVSTLFKENLCFGLHTYGNAKY